MVHVAGREQHAAMRAAGGAASPWLVTQASPCRVSAWRQRPARHPTRPLGGFQPEPVGFLELVGHGIAAAGICSVSRPWTDATRPAARARSVDPNPDDTTVFDSDVASAELMTDAGEQSRRCQRSARRPVNRQTCRTERPAILRMPPSRVTTPRFTSGAYDFFATNVGYRLWRDQARPGPCRRRCLAQSADLNLEALLKHPAQP